uniref:Major facilitator superfamily (MFS) profile domain-containing protein n=1 Tax=Mola mola TaxID=94237 RepID=A0A3Q3WZ54_MOLML
RNLQNPDFESTTAFLGKWGRFQQQVFFLLCLRSIPTGYIGLSVVFLADTPQHRCFIPAHANVSAAWRNRSVPPEEGPGGGLALSQCSRYRLEDMVRFSEGDLLPGVDVNLTNVATEGCLDGWEYDQSVYTSTVVSEWDLVCDDQWKKPLTSSVFFFGILIGSFISGQLSDRFGRKIVTILALVVQAFFTFISIFSPSWAFFCCLYFFVGVGNSSGFVAAFVLGTEIFGPHVRKIFSTLGSNLVFAVGYMLLPLFAFITRDWKMLLVALTLPIPLYLPLWWYVPESPRWLLSQGRVEEAEAIIREAAKKNKIEPPSLIFAPLQGKTQNICDLIGSQNIRGVSFTLICIAIAYFAVSLNTVNLHGNSYLNCFLSATVELPAYVLSWIMFRRCSRRLCLFSTLFTTGLFLLFVQLMPASMTLSKTELSKFAVTIAFSIVYGYTVEVYPTVLRTTALGTSSMIARIGSILSPYIIYLRSYSLSLPYILIGCFSVLCALLSLLLPETYGMPLPDTISQMQRFPGAAL